MSKFHKKGSSALGTLSRFTEEQLKTEIQRRRELDRARKYLPSAETALIRAQKKVTRYRTLIAEFGQVDSEQE